LTPVKKADDDEAHYHKYESAPHLESLLPTLLVLFMPGDTPRHWFLSGLARMRVELLARHAGVWCAAFDPALRFPGLRSRLSAMIRIEGEPQALLGVGYGAEAWPAPRRDVREMLLS
jgi:hypothetical protein